MPSALVDRNVALYGGIVNLDGWLLPPIRSPLDMGASNPDAPQNVRGEHLADDLAPDDLKQRILDPASDGVETALTTTPESTTRI